VTSKTPTLSSKRSPGFIAMFPGVRSARPHAGLASSVRKGTKLYAAEWKVKTHFDERAIPRAHEHVPFFTCTEVRERSRL